MKSEPSNRLPSGHRLGRLQGDGMESLKFENSKNWGVQNRTHEDVYSTNLENIKVWNIFLAKVPVCRNPSADILDPPEISYLVHQSRI